MTGNNFWEKRLSWWFSHNSEVEATWTSLIGWPHKTSTTYILQQTCKTKRHHPRNLLSTITFQKKTFLLSIIFYFDYYLFYFFLVPHYSNMSHFLTIGICYWEKKIPMVHYQPLLKVKVFPPFFIFRIGVRIIQI